mmetsp:Transcript_38826/g.75744  ORF Transcript_38826/g.75744 Transcript_38826/m.75744 type:complete len:105 (+) Transcript_38826:94-408(+)
MVRGLVLLMVRGFVGARLGYTRLPPSPIILENYMLPPSAFLLSWYKVGSSNPDNVQARCSRRLNFRRPISKIPAGSQLPEGLLAADSIYISTAFNESSTMAVYI